MGSKRAPSHLSATSRRLWHQLTDAFSFEVDHLLTLQTALEALDRLREARELIDAEGIVVETPSGFKRPHPALRVEVDARNGFLRSWAALGLNLDPPGDVGRPPGS